VNRKKKPGLLAAEEDLSKAQLPKRDLCLDANVAMLHPLRGTACGMGPTSKVRLARNPNPNPSPDPDPNPNHLTSANPKPQPQPNPNPNQIRYLALLCFYSPARRFTTSMFIFLSGSLSGLRFTQAQEHAEP